MSTNPAYKELAYRKALLQHTIHLLVKSAVGTNGSPPTDVVVCSDVLSDEERVIDPDHIMWFIQELELEKAQVALEMGRFGFVERKDGQGKLTTRRKTSRRSRAKK